MPLCFLDRAFKFELFEENLLHKFSEAREK